MNNLILDGTGAAEFLGVTKKCLESMRARGDGPAYCKVGRLVKYRLADLEAYLESHRVDPANKSKRAKVTVSA